MKILAFGLLAAAAVFVLRSIMPGGEGHLASTLTHVPENGRLETATFGAGCFWHVEETFRSVEGVVNTAVGFEGGTKPEPTYRDVCTNQTGHAEVVRIEYDPSKLSYHKLLEVFFSLHDPTTANRQGFDVGVQYRSVIFYHTAEQQREAESYKAELGRKGAYDDPIVTAIEPASTFWKAEEYHQQYYEKKGG